MSFKGCGANKCFMNKIFEGNAHYTTTMVQVSFCPICKSRHMIYLKKSKVNTQAVLKCKGCGSKVVVKLKNK